MIRVMIADDQELIRDSLNILISSCDEFEVVASSENGFETVSTALNIKPDVILMDIRMPGRNGIECIQLIKDELPDIKIIVLTTFDDNEYIFDSIKFGADGYLLKTIPKEELKKAIKTVYAGGALINPNVAAKAFKLFTKLAKADYSIKNSYEILEIITPREQHIISMIRQGLSNKEIAFSCHLSEGTVRNYISRILNKLALKDRTQIAIFAVQNDIKQPENYD